MAIMEVVDKLSEEAILLEPGKVQSCGKMLSLLDELDHPGVAEEKSKLKDFLETMILQDLEGGNVDIDEIIALVEKIQTTLRGIETGDVAAKEPGEESQAEWADGNDDSAIMDEIPLDDEMTAADDDIPEAAVEAAVKPAPAPPKPPAPVAEKPPAHKPLQPAPPEDSEDDENYEEAVEEVDLVSDFIAEAREHLESIELNMVEWERSPNDKEIINSIFRPFHTIKGVAGFLNLKKINHISHQLENLLDEARDGNLKLTPELSDLIFDGVDTLKAMIGSLSEAVSAGTSIRYSIDTRPLFAKIRSIISMAGTEIDTEEILDNPPPIGSILVQEGKIREEDLEEMLEKQRSSEQKRPVGEMLIEDKKVSARDVRDAIRQQAETAKAKIEKHIKVDTHKMDQLLDMVGELVIAQSMITHNPDVVTITNQRFIRDISQLSRVTSTLQNISMSMRLVPIGQTFQKMNRIVRDLARKSGKNINLVLQGESAEIDRNMVEELYDPLVHMIRNSCDHGIQTSDKRVANGKSTEGTIVLKAEHAGGKIVITISDDGEGLDREAILAKAREKGLLSGNERPDDKIINNFIFAPGFSTAKQVTDVSGRGVGMDVVRKSLEKLHGTVEIDSKPGIGTTFVIKLPLTTAIIDGMLVQVGDERYIIPTLSVRQLVHPKREDITKVVGKGEMVQIRGRLLPLVKLNSILNITGKCQEAWEGVLVIVEDSGREIAVQVDSVIGKQEVVIKSLNERYSSQNGIAGGAILGDGRVGLILDIRSITSMF